jgi:hypothetical protein
MKTETYPIYKWREFAISSIHFGLVMYYFNADDDTTYSPFLLYLYLL